MTLQLKIKKLHPDAVVPKYATAGAACFDLHAIVENDVSADAGLNPFEIRASLKLQKCLKLVKKFGS